MYCRSCHFLLAAVLGLAACAATQAQDKAPAKAMADGPPAIDEVRPGEEYRQFFKKPTTVPQYWTAMSFELEVGKKDLAAMLLHGLLNLKPTDEELVKIEEQDGMIAFLRLRNIRPWVPALSVNDRFFKEELARIQKEGGDDSQNKIARARDEWDAQKRAYNATVKLNEQAYKDVEELIKLVTTAVKKHLSDPARINKYVQALKASREEREYALKELFRSGALVTPYLLNELRSASTEERPLIMGALIRLGDNIVPPLLAALDTEDTQLLGDVIDVLVRRKAVEIVPRLWYLSASSAYPPDIRRKATAALVGFLATPVSRLLPAKAALTREAEKYYQHEVKFGDPRAVEVWRWDGKQVTLTALPATKVEEYYGLKFARQALQLDPAYRPAQLVLLSLVLDKTYERAGLAEPLAKSAPAVHDMLATTSPDLLLAVLERGLAEKHTPLVLGAIRTLGGLSEVRAGRPEAAGPGPFARALNYPDRRVQFAAAEALLNTPAARFIAADHAHRRCAAGPRCRAGRQGRAARAGGLLHPGAGQPRQRCRPHCRLRAGGSAYRPRADAPPQRIGGHRPDPDGRGLA